MTAIVNDSAIPSYALTAWQTPCASSNLSTKLTPAVPIILEKEARGKKNKTKTLPEWLGGVNYNGVNCPNFELNHFSLFTKNRLSRVSSWAFFFPWATEDRLQVCEVLEMEHEMWYVCASSRENPYYFLEICGKKKKKKLRTTDVTDLNSQSGNTTSSWRTVGGTLNFLDVPPPFD